MQRRSFHLSWEEPRAGSAEQALGPRLPDAAGVSHLISASPASGKLSGQALAHFPPGRRRPRGADAHPNIHTPLCRITPAKPSGGQTPGPTGWVERGREPEATENQRVVLPPPRLPPASLCQQQAGRQPETGLRPVPGPYPPQRLPRRCIHTAPSVRVNPNNNPGVRDPCLHSQVTNEAPEERRLRPTFIQPRRLMQALLPPRFTGEQTEAWRDQETQLRSQLSRKEMGLGSNHLLLNPSEPWLGSLIS